MARGLVLYIRIVSPLNIEHQNLDLPFQTWRQIYQACKLAFLYFRLNQKKGLPIQKKTLSTNTVQALILLQKLP